MAEKEKDWKETIQKLMNKAEDPATTPAERDAIVERVTYLMAKHGIEEAMLSAAEERTAKVVNQGYKITAPYVNQKMTMLNNIGIAFGCQSVRMADDRLVMYGHEDDMEKVFMLYGSLLIQMVTSLGSVVKPSHVHGKTFNTSFVNGYVFEVVKRVKDAYKRARQDVQNSTGNGMELVLRDRAVAVRDAYRTDHPFTRVSNSRSSITSEAGYNAGKSAGASANIGQTGLGGGRRSISN